VRSLTVEDAAVQLGYARSVIFIPGYGMAVAQAQHALKELTDEIEKRGGVVKFAVHPVAGRMPGHMNVLLAEANVPYDKLKDMDEINPEFDRCDVAVVVGANDVVNPAARHDTSSPIYGMPMPRPSCSSATRRRRSRSWWARSGTWSSWLQSFAPSRSRCASRRAERTLRLAPQGRGAACRSLRNCPGSSTRGWATRSRTSL
jgi:hypothetical protein